MYSLKDKSPRDSFIWGYKECKKVLKKKGIKKAQLFFNNRKIIWEKTKNYSDKKAYDGAKKAILESSQNVYLKKDGQDYANAVSLNIKNKTLPTNVSVACVIAFKDRHDMVEVNIRSLLMQSLSPAIILVASNPSDLVFSKKMQEKYSKVFFVVCPNFPVGKKWDTGVQFAKLINPESLLILGSDDVLSPGYIQEAYKKIGKGSGSKIGAADLVGSIKWRIYDSDKKLYSLSYNDKIVKITLGGGRLYSRYFLDSCEWSIFDKGISKNLDNLGHNKVVAFSDKIELISDSEFILSIEGNWEVMNSAKNILRAKNKISSKNITSRKNETLSKFLGINFNDLL